MQLLSTTPLRPPRWRVLRPGNLLAWTCLLAWSAPVRADVFVLDGGGEVRGELQNKDEKPRASYVVKTAAGGQVTLAADQVKEVKHQTAQEMEFDRVAPDYEDTIAGNWELAEFCRKKSLVTQRKVLLEKIIALDPDHAAARRGLGYTQIQGRWEMQDKLMTEAGYVKYKGAWRLPQEVTIMEQKRKEELAQKAWFKKLQTWRKWLDTDKANQARINFDAIHDPYAAKGLTYYLERETDRDIKLMLIDVLARLESSWGMDAILAASLADEDEEIRLACLEKIVRLEYKPAVTKYVQALKSKDNIQVNRAAIGLGQMKDPSAIGPLIDALETTHTYKIVKKPAGQTSSTFGSGGGSPGGFSFGGGGTETIKRVLRNQDVLAALVTLTHPINFDFDEHAWKYWYAAQKKPQSLNARRD